MLASGQFFTEKIDEYLILGELALDGRVRAVKGSLAAAMLAGAQERRGVIVPARNAAEAAVVDGLDVIAVNFLSDAVGFLTDELPALSIADGPIEPTVVDLEKAFAAAGRYDVDFSDPEVHRDGQESAKRAVTVAAAGHHNPDGHRESARRAPARPCTQAYLRTHDPARPYALVSQSLIDLAERV